MTDRIDHAAEARKHIDWTHNWQEKQGDTEETGLATAMLAQAHATLALVEQQRIANLIALATYTGEEEAPDLLRAEAGGALAKWVPHGPDDEHPEIHPDIAAALGIEVKPAVGGAEPSDLSELRTPDGGDIAAGDNPPLWDDDGEQWAWCGSCEGYRIGLPGDDRHEDCKTVSGAPREALERLFGPMTETHPAVGDQG